MTTAPLNGPRIEPQSDKPAESLVILLHGYGSNGEDLINLAENWKTELPDTLFVAPNAPHPCAAGFGYEWFPLTNRDPEERWNGVQSAAPQLNKFIDDELKANNLPDKQLALVGFSQGSMMALHVGLRRKNSPACIVSYSGMLAGAEHIKEQAKVAPPLMMFHGDQDDIIPIEALPFSIAALEGAGQTVLPHVMKGIGHGIDAESINLGGEFIKGTLGMEFMSNKDT